MDLIIIENQLLLWKQFGHKLGFNKTRWDTYVFKEIFGDFHKFCGLFTIYEL